MRGRAERILAAARNQRRALPLKPSFGSCFFYVQPPPTPKKLSLVVASLCRRQRQPTRVLSPVLPGPLLPNGAQEEPPDAAVHFVQRPPLLASAATPSSSSLLAVVPTLFVSHACGSRAGSRRRDTVTYALPRAALQRENKRTEKTDHQSNPPPPTTTPGCLSCFPTFGLVSFPSLAPCVRAPAHSRRGHYPGPVVRVALPILCSQPPTLPSPRRQPTSPPPPPLSRALRGREGGGLRAPGRGAGGTPSAGWLAHSCRRPSAPFPSTVTHLRSTYRETATRKATPAAGVTPVR